MFFKLGKEPMRMVNNSDSLFVPRQDWVDIGWLDEDETKREQWGLSWEEEEKIKKMAKEISTVLEDFAERHFAERNETA